MMRVDVYKRQGLEAAYIGPEGFEARLSELLAERGIGLVVLAGFLRILLSLIHI